MNVQLLTSSIKNIPIVNFIDMSKRKTKEQKILATLKKLQTDHQNNHDNQPISPINTISTVKTVPTSPFRYEPKTTDLKNSHAYVKKDLLKILILATLAIGIQIVLSLLINNGKLKLPF